MRPMVRPKSLFLLLGTFLKYGSTVHATGVRLSSVGGAMQSNMLDRRAKDDLQTDEDMGMSISHTDSRCLACA